MYPELLRPTLLLIAWLIGCLVLHAAEPTAETPPPRKAEWRSNYAVAQDAAKSQKKLLLLVFTDPANPLCQRFESETLADAVVASKLPGYVCAKLPLDVKIVDLEGKELTLLQHPVFKEMQGQPGIAILDYAHQDTPLHGTLVSAFPLNARLWYTPQQMQVILDLPAGTLTQRTLVYAVRIHPEAPASAAGTPDARLVAEAESHSDYQARIRLQGHHRWDARFPRISALLGCTPREVCAESWPGQTLVEAAIECVRCWRCSHGHWSAVRAGNRGFGYDMKRGANGVWYATGIFGLR